MQYLLDWLRGLEPTDCKREVAIATVNLERIEGFTGKQFDKKLWIQLGKLY